MVERAALTALVARLWRSHIHSRILLKETGGFEYKPAYATGITGQSGPWNMVHAE
jgi:hypothetical protein